MAVFGIGKLSQEQIDVLNDLYRRTQENPSVYSAERVAAIAELKRRVDNKSIQPFAPAKKKLYKGLEVTEQERQAALQPPPPPSNINANQVIQQKEKEDELQKSINLKKQQKTEFYTNALGVNPYEDKEGAYNEWFQGQNQQSLMQIIEDKKISNTQELRDSFFKSLEKGTLQEDFEVGGPIEKPKEIKKITLKEGEVPETGEEYADMLWQIALEKYEKGEINSPWDYIKSREAYEGDESVVNWGGLKKQSIMNDTQLILKGKYGNLYPTGAPMGKAKDLDEKIAEFDFMYGNRAEIKGAKGEDVVDFWDALFDVWDNPTDLIMYVKDIKDADIYAKMWMLISKHKKGEKLTESEIEFIRTWLEEEEKAHTDGARIVEGIAGLIPFMQEFYTGGLIFKRLAKGGKDLAWKQLREETREYVAKNLATKGGKLLIETGRIGVQATAMTAVKYAVGPEFHRQMIQSGNIQISDEGLLTYGEFISEKTARIRAITNLGIEYTSEMLGLHLMKIMKGSKNLLTSAYNKLPDGAKIVIQNEAFINSLTKTIKKFKPDIKIDEAVLSQLRKYAAEAGYHGVIEEWSEERAGEATRVFLAKLGEAGIIDGFDESFAEGIYYELAKTGDLNKFLHDQFVEGVILSVPGGAMALASGTVAVADEKAARESNPEIFEAIDKSNKQAKETEEELKTIDEKIESEGTNKLDEKKTTRLNELEEKEELNEEEKEEYQNLSQEKRILGYTSLSKKEQKRFTEIIEIKQNNTTLNTLKSLLIDNPEISKEVNLAEIDLEEEIQKTRKELEEEFGEDFVGGEGMEESAEKFTVLGYTTFSNLQLKLGLKKGATYDTVVEEYYGLIRRGGLTNEQRDIYDKHYDKYKTDKEYREKINKFINDQVEKMGFGADHIDINQTLSRDKLFDKEGKAYEFKSLKEKKEDMADKVLDYVSSIFNKAFGRIDAEEGVRSIYKQVRKRKLKISSKRAKELEKRKKTREKPKKVKAKERKPKKVKKKKKKGKPSYQLTPIGYQSGKGPSKKDNINMMFGRETGHFGSGTYFFGSEKDAKKHARGREGGDRPITEINLEGKNLFRPFDFKHKSGETFKAGGNFGMANELHWILRYVNEASYKLGDYDAKNNPNSIIWRDNPTGISKRLEDWTGLKASPKIVDEVIQEVRAEIEANDGFGGLNTETASTRLMRRLGFDGIDMRGIEGFDNANFGSVLYPDKPKAKPEVSYQLTDVNIPAQESKPSYQLQVADINKIKDCPPGRCFKNAVRASKVNPGSKVIQGRVYMPRYDEMKEHSWMEIENIVYDPAIDLVIKKEDFYNAVKNLDPSGVGIKVINELSVSEAGLLSTNFGYKLYTKAEVDKVRKPEVSYQLTPTQKKAFKDVHPELLNTDGSPKVFYHGTTAEDFDRFDMTRVGEGSGMRSYGMNFTSNPKVASAYTQEGINPWSKRGPDATGKIYPVHLLGKKNL